MHSKRQDVAHGYSDRITSQLTRQAETIRTLANGVPDAQARWKPSPDDWSILEVIHHLYDEEIEASRPTWITSSTMPDQPWPRIDPGGWVTQRRYNEQDPAATLASSGPRGKVAGLAEQLGRAQLGRGDCQCPGEL